MGGYELTYFPGSVPHDGRRQLNMYFGYSAMNLHHPYFSTQIMGLLYSAGNILFGQNGGVFLYTAVQTVLGAFVFAEICSYIRKKTRSDILALLALIFYGLTPVWWTYMQAFIKDTMYFIFFSLFILECVKLLLRDAGRYTVAILSFAALMSCLLRNGATYVILPSYLIILVICKGNRLRLFISFIAVSVLSIGLTVVLMDYMGLKSDNQVEDKSVPLQQIARVVSKYGYEFTDEERNIINRVVEFDGIDVRYNPEIADPVKNHYKGTTENEWHDFWDLYFRKMKDHPYQYLLAAMNNMFGYTDPYYYSTIMCGYQLYNKEPLGDFDQGVIYSQYYFSDTARRIVSNEASLWDKIPVISFFTNPGFYTWIGIILTGYVIRRREWSKVLFFIIPALVIGMCFLSPVNGLVRYMLPVMATMPLYLLVGGCKYENS